MSQQTAEHSQLAAWYRRRMPDAPAELLRRFSHLAQAHDLMSRQPEIEPTLLRLKGMAGEAVFGRFIRSIQ